MRVAYIHCDTTLINNEPLKICPSDIKYENKDHAAWLSIVFSFDVKFIFLIEDTEEEYKLVYQNDKNIK